MKLTGWVLLTILLIIAFGTIGYFEVFWSEEESYPPSSSINMVPTPVPASNYPLSSTPLPMNTPAANPNGGR